MLVDTLPPLTGRDFLRVEDLSTEEMVAVLDLADELKAMQGARIPHALLPGRALGLIFQKASTRTRVSFEVGMYQLGGSAVHLSAAEMQLGRGEPIRDTGIVLGRYLDAIMIRANSHTDVEELAAASTAPVINGLTELHHPCQALADVQTLRERLGDLEGRRLAWVGDGHDNVCHSLLTAAGRMGMQITVATPAGYEPDADVVAGAGAVRVVEDPLEAVAGAEAVVTDVWTSMGQEAEHDRRLRDLAPFRLDEDKLALAASDAVAMHCLPAHVGEEITDGVLYGDRSAVWDQAENRLHAYKAVLALTVR